MFCTVTMLALYQALTVFAQVPPSSSSSGKVVAVGEEGDHLGASYEDSMSEYDVPYALQNILYSDNSNWTYPTDFTRDIMPKMLHSHNDYWRDAPYYSALSVGAISVESDVWLINGTLHVGHEPSALTAARTFESLYVNPILDTLNRQNPKTPFATGKTNNGVFDTASTQTMYLWIDCKTSGEETFLAAIEALKPLSDAGYLTSYSPDKGVTPSAITVIGTGNTPLSLFTDPTQPRAFFFDADLPELGPSGTQSNITSNVTQIASYSFGATIGSIGMNGSETLLTPPQLQKLRSQISTARAKGIGARYWDTPEWPIYVRNGLWRTLYENGVALINVDDLVGAALGEWRMN